jgi:curved DNA-binding protein CbpA
LIDQLAAVESEIRVYNRRMERMRNKENFGMAYDNVEELFRRTWEVPPPAAAAPPPEPPTPADEQQIKRLYRQLARRFHPDLAGDPAERAYRTEKMTAINDAYAARSLAELVALSERQDMAHFSTEKRGQTEEQMVRALEEEIGRIHRRLHQIRFEINNLPNRSSIQLSLEVKMARRQGRDLLAEMAADLEKKLARKSAEREFLKSQFDQLGLQPEIRGRK